MTRTQNVGFERTIDGLELRVEAVVMPGRPGKYYGKPEDCYPDEPAEFDIESIFLIDEATGLAGSVSIKDVFEGMTLERAKMQVLDLFEAMAITKIGEGD